MPAETGINSPTGTSEVFNVTVTQYQEIGFSEVAKHVAKKPDSKEKHGVHQG